jgi:hypothetical protein
MYGQLVDFHKVRPKAHCRVPYTDEENPALGHWVAKQRGAFKGGDMDEERMNRLKQLHFTWNMKGNPRK